MNIETIVLILGLAALAYAWYTERRARRDAEIKADVATRRTTLDGIQKQLDENKVALDAAKAELDGAPIPGDMLEHIGQPDPRSLATKRSEPNLQPDVRSGRLIDTASGAIVDPRGPGEAAEFNGT